MEALNASLSGSKLVWGAAAIVANLGSRFIIAELTPAQQGVLSSTAFKRVALFCMIFLPTRDLLLAACLTVAVSALLEGLLHEGSRFCVLPECLRRGGERIAPPSNLPIASRAPAMGPAAAAAAWSRSMRGGRDRDRWIQDHVVEVDDEVLGISFG